MSFYNPLVSIVIPVYNGSNFLKEAIQSALNQTYKKIEVIVINDGSNDNDKTEKIALSFKDKIKYYKKENGGVSSALNLGIKKMNGDFFSWLSHDDLYDKDKIKKQVDFLNSINKPQIVGCNFRLQTLKCDDIAKFKIKKNILENGKDVLNNWIHFCCLLIDKNLIVETGGFNELNKTCQDIEMLFKLVKKNKIFFLTDILVTRREHVNQGSRTQLTAHLIEKNNFYKNLVINFDYEFFQDKHEKLSKYSTLCYLGDYCMKIGLNKASKKYFRKAFFKKPISPKLFLFMLFGNFFWKKFNRN